jgi:NitT/TauT family transport system permease protein
MSGAPRRFDRRGLLLPVLLLVFAELAFRLSGIQSDSLAPPSKVLVAGIDAVKDGSLLLGTAQTLGSVAVGVAIGFSLGLAVGIALGMFQSLNRLLEVSIEAIRPVPAISLFPIGLLVFGLGYKMELAIVAFASLWPALILSRAAVAGVEPRLFEVARLLHMGFFARTVKIVLPATLPRIFVALRLTLGLGLVIAVTLEVSSNTIGLGYAMAQAQVTLDPARMLAFLVWIGVVGWAFNAVMVAAQQRIFGPRLSGAGIS